MKLLKWSLAVLLTLLALVVAAAGAALATERGLRAAVSLASWASGGALDIAGVQGRLLGESELRDLRYAGSDGLTVTIPRLHLRIQPRALLQRRLHVARLEVSSFDLDLGAEQPEDEEETRLPSRLPLDLVVDSFALGGLHIHRGEEVIFHLDGGELAGAWIAEEIVVSRLVSALPQTGPLQLAGRARMAADRIEFRELRVQGPGELSAAGTFGIGAAASDLSLQWRRLQWPLVNPEGPPAVGALQGEATFKGALDDFAYELQTQGVVRDVNAQLLARGRGSRQGIGFDTLRLATDKGSLETQGALTWSPVFTADLEAQFSELDPGLLAPAWSGTLNGSLRTQTRPGMPPRMGFDLQLERSTLRGQPLALAARGDTDFAGARIEQLQLRGGGGTVSAQGDVAWSPALVANLEARLDGLDPGQFAPGWPGRVNGSVQLRTELREAVPDLRFVARIGNSRLRGHPLRLEARGRWHASALDMEALQLASGATQVSAQGRLTPPFDLQGRLASPDLAQLYPDLGGRLQASFTLQGPLETPHLITRGEGAALAFREFRVGRLSWDMDVDPRVESRARLEARDADVGLVVPSFALTAQGREVYHELSIKAITERGDLDLALEGGYDRRRREWGGHVTSSRLAPKELPPWTQEKSAPLLLGRTRQSLEPVCLSGAAGSACLRLEQNVAREGLRLSWDLKRLHLGAFKPLLPPDYELQGEADGSGSLEIAGGDVEAISAQLELTQARVSAPEVPALEILPSTLRAELVDDRLRAVANLSLKQGALTADVTAEPAARFVERPLSGRVQVRVPDLAFAEQFSRELKGVRGRLDGALELAGTAGLPRLRGAVTLSGGQARLVTPGIELRELGLRLSGDGQGPLALEGSVQSGSGKLALSGSVDPASAPPRADLTLKGQDFQAIATPDARVWIAPDLRFVSDAAGLHLSGSLTVPKAEITPRKGVGDEGVSVSEDQVIVGAPPVERGASLRFFSDVRVVLGEAVSFKGYGLNTRMEGAVSLMDEPQRETRADGELRLVDGRYKAYGQDLNIGTGRLIFEGGPITDPALDFYATRRPQADVLVGVRVRGSLDRPVLTLHSDPSMPREQQLSWLVLGRPLEQNSSADRDAVTQAALALGLYGGDFLAQRLGKGIGLDQISIGAAPVGGSEVAADAGAIAGSQAARGRGAYSYNSQQAQLTLGKYLTPKLFISYGVSLFQPGQTFRLLYDLGRGFKLQTESGVASGGDLLYTFER